MLPTPADMKIWLEQHVSGLQPAVEGSILIVPAADLVRVCRALKDSPEWRLDYLSNLTAIDYPAEQRIDTVYHLYSMALKHGPLTLKVRLPRATPNVPSLTQVYRGAEFQEREAYDLYGVIFERHPDLRRILMWDEFAGHPMRKDYVPEDQDASDPSATWKVRG